MSDNQSPVCQTHISTDGHKNHEDTSSQQSGVSLSLQPTALTQTSVNMYTQEEIERGKINARMVGLGRYARDMMDIYKGVSNIETDYLVMIVSRLIELTEEYDQWKSN